MFMFSFGRKEGTSQDQATRSQRYPRFSSTQTWQIPKPNTNEAKHSKGKTYSLGTGINASKTLIRAGSIVFEADTRIRILLGFPRRNRGCGYFKANLQESSALNQESAGNFPPHPHRMIIVHLNLLYPLGFFL
uniref:Uncharacterized protein n=1 Tax=Bionectria ochroleuca TaxID=29856 RepID=A0A8H7N688_BIOOC